MCDLSVMPPSKLSAEERSAKATQHGQAILVKADVQLVVACMKYSGASAVSACKRTLVDLKYIVGDKIVRVDPENSPVTGAILDKVPANSVPEALVPLEDRPAPVLGWTWRLTQVAVLRQAISDVEPTICSHANLRVLAKKHAKDPPLAPVLEIWEFLFVLDPDGAPPPFHDYG